MAGNTEQKITVKADFTGLDKIKQAKREYENLAESANMIGTGDSATGGSTGGIGTQQVKQQQEINHIRKMEQTTKKMAGHMHTGEMYGTNGNLQNLKKTNQEYNKMSGAMSDMEDHSEEIRDNFNEARGGRRGKGGGNVPSAGVGGAKRGAGGIAIAGTGLGVVAGMNQETLAQTAISGTKSMGGSLSGLGGGLGKLGMALGGIGAVGGAAWGLMGLMGGQEEKRLGITSAAERRAGRPITKAQAKLIQNTVEGRGIESMDQAEMYQALSSAMQAGGGTGVFSGSPMGNIRKLVGAGMDSQQAGALVGMQRRAGGGNSMSGTLATAQWSFGKGRIPEFMDAVNDMTSSLQASAELVSPREIAKSLGRIGARDESLRGASGVRTAQTLQSAITGSTGLSSARDALIFRALSDGGDASYTEIMDRMAKGLGDDQNVEDIVKFVKNTAATDEGRIAMLEMFRISRGQAKGLLKPVPKGAGGKKAGIWDKSRQESWIGEQVEGQAMETGEAGETYQAKIKKKAKEITKDVLNFVTGDELNAAYGYLDKGTKFTGGTSQVGPYGGDEISRLNPSDLGKYQENIGHVQRQRQANQFFNKALVGGWTGKGYTGTAGELQNIVGPMEEDQQYKLRSVYQKLYATAALKPELGIDPTTDSAYTMKDFVETLKKLQENGVNLQEKINEWSVGAPEIKILVTKGSQVKPENAK